MLRKTLLGWSAERNGRRDGRNAIPLPDDATPPPYLLYLRDAGQGRLRRLELSWKWKDKALFPAWARRQVRHEQAQAALARAEAAVAGAIARCDASPKAKHLSEAKKAQHNVARAQKRLNRAHELLVHARAKRQARWNIYQARLSTITDDVHELMQRYITANVGARDDGRTPAGLLDANRPRLHIPAALQHLTWDEEDPRRA